MRPQAGSLHLKWRCSRTVEHLQHGDKRRNGEWGRQSLRLAGGLVQEHGLLGRALRQAPDVAQQYAEHHAVLALPRTHLHACTGLIDATAQCASMICWGVPSWEALMWRGRMLSTPQALAAALHAQHMVQSSQHDLQTPSAKCFFIVNLFSAHTAADERSQLHMPG
jgi:hypothetical protein